MLYTKQRDMPRIPRQLNMAVTPPKVHVSSADVCEIELRNKASLSGPSGDLSTFYNAISDVANI
jgi:hypothetical protein